MRFDGFCLRTWKISYYRRFLATITFHGRYAFRLKPKRYNPRMTILARKVKK